MLPRVIPFVVLLLAMAAPAQQKSAFRWPEGKRAAVSLSFDDARLSQIDVGMPLFDGAGVKATFYISPGNLEKRLEGWKKAVAAGHEIANHSRSHPCTGNYAFSKKNPLESYTLERMEEELDGANTIIQSFLGVKPVSFGYPCGLKFVGRGVETKSYVPLVAKQFLSGRGYRDEAANDPEVCDMAQLMGTGIDELTFDGMVKHASTALKEGRWVIFAGHEIGKTAFQTTDAAALEQFCRYAKDPANGIWLDTVESIGRYVVKQRSGGGAGGK